MFWPKKFLAEKFFVRIFFVHPSVRPSVRRPSVRRPSTAETSHLLLRAIYWMPSLCVCVGGGGMAISLLMLNGKEFPVLRTYRRPSLHMWLGVKGRRQAHRSATSDNQISKPTFPGGRGSRARHNVSCAVALLQDILCLAPRPSDAHAWKLVDKSMQNLH